MGILDLAKGLKRKITWESAISKEYKKDCRRYLKYNYGNISVKSKNAMEAKILRQTHVLEKGMSLLEPKPEFGVAKAVQLIGFIEEFARQGYSVSESGPLQNALGVIDEYIKFHEQRGFKPEPVISDFSRIKVMMNGFYSNCGTAQTTREELERLAHGEFPDFFASRHSIRQFDGRKPDTEQIKQAVGLAMKAPSACNRQSCKVYLYEDDEINKRIGKYIAGNAGFESEVQRYIVLTGDISAYYDAFERNQVYIDGGIFALAVAQSLHYYGIGSCMLQNGETNEKDKEIRSICENIPDNELILMFIAVGYYKDKFSYAVSNRKRAEDILVVEEAR